MKLINTNSNKNLNNYKFLFIPLIFIISLITTYVLILFSNELLSRLVKIKLKIIKILLK
jgi:hypothetical protein